MHNEPKENKVFVAGLNYQTSENTLLEFMQQVGKVTSYRIIYDHIKKRSKGYGFVTYETPEEAQRAISELNLKELEGRSLSVKVYLDKNR